MQTETQGIYITDHAVERVRWRALGDLTFGHLVTATDGEIREAILSAWHDGLPHTISGVDMGLKRVRYGDEIADRTTYRRSGRWVFTKIGQTIVTSYRLSKRELRNSQRIQKKRAAAQSRKKPKKPKHGKPKQRGRKRQRW